GPVAAVSVSHWTANSSSVNAGPRFLPSSWNWRLLTFRCSVTEALTWILPFTVLPVFGASIRTVGNGFDTMIVTGSEKTLVPARVVTTARRVCGPSARAAVSTSISYSRFVMAGPVALPARWHWRLEALPR